MRFIPLLLPRNLDRNTVPFPKECRSFLKNIFGKVLGICLTWNTPQKIHSTPDYCKLYSGIEINTNTVNGMCAANPSLEMPSCNYYYNVNYNKHANNPMSQYFPCENCTSWNNINCHQREIAGNVKKVEEK